MHPSWYPFVQEYVDAALVLNCKAHKMAIPHKQCRFGKQTTGQNREILVDRYFTFMDRMSRNPWPECKQLLMDKMTAVKQLKAADKFIKHHAS